MPQKRDPKTGRFLAKGRKTKTTRTSAKRKPLKKTSPYPVGRLYTIDMLKPKGKDRGEKKLTFKLLRGRVDVKGALHLTFQSNHGEKYQIRSAGKMWNFLKRGSSNVLVYLGV